MLLVVLGSRLTPSQIKQLMKGLSSEALAIPMGFRLKRFRVEQLPFRWVRQKDSRIFMNRLNQRHGRPNERGFSGAWAACDQGMRTIHAGQNGFALLVR